jgi:hypothetical protein
VLTLGSLSSVCVLDKKGVLSWPNPTPEKIFIFNDNTDCNQPTTNTGPLTVEVLNLTQQSDVAFAVGFDDPNWSLFLPNLKPIAENILLNNCCQFNCEYNRFIDHVAAVSHYVERTISVANRRCLCYFIDALG